MEDAIDLINLIHALENTGSKKAIPYLLPFYNSNNHLELTAVDALRTVSRDETVQMTFASFVKHATSENQVMQVVESLIFHSKGQFTILIHQVIQEKVSQNSPS